MTGYRVLDLAELSVDAVTDENRWLDLCDLMAETFHLRSAMVFLFPLEKSARPMPFLSRRLRSDDNSALDRFMDADDRDDLPAFERLSRMIPQTLYPERKIWGVASDDEMPPSSMRELLRTELGIHSRLAAKLNINGPWMDMLALHPPFRSDQVDPSIFTDMNALLPVFAKCLNTHRAMETLKRRFGACLAALDRLDFGTALVDESGRIAFANAMMNDVLADRDGIERAGDRLVVGRREMQAAFARALAWACNPQVMAGDRALLALSVPRRSGKAPYFLKLHAIADVHRETDITRPFALLFVIDPTRAAGLSAEGIGALSVLSPAELEVCRYLLVGADTHEIAEQRDVSLETVRQQIKSVLAKLNCRNRSQVLNVALTTHLPLRADSPAVGDPPMEG